MLRDPPQDALGPPSEKGPDPLANRAKVRIRFKKGGDLRLVSHHDLMHVFERMFRRAALPFHSTEGFNPKPKMAFALSLALGVEGHVEVVELVLEEELPLEEVQARLVAQAPARLEILTVRRVDTRASAQPRRACYRIKVPADRCSGLEERITAVLAETHCWVERQRPQPRRIDIRPYLRAIAVAD